MGQRVKSHLLSLAEIEGPLLAGRGPILQHNIFTTAKKRQFPLQLGKPDRLCRVMKAAVPS
jgi:hypothetical protein